MASMCTLTPPTTQCQVVNTRMRKKMPQRLTIVKTEEGCDELESCITDLGSIADRSSLKREDGELGQEMLSPIQSAGSDGVAASSSGNRGFARLDDGEADMEDDDADLDKYGDDNSVLPISAHSVDFKLPTRSDGMFSAITRMRHTTNQYVLALTKVDWFSTYKLPTMRALVRRLARYSPEISALADVEVRIGYRQVVYRLHCLNQFYKTLVRWTNTQRFDELAKASDPFFVVSAFLEFKEAKLAPDLSIVTMSMRFSKVLADGGSLLQALSQVDLGLLAQWRDEVQAERETKSAASTEVKQEVEAPRTGLFAKKEATSDESSAKKRRRVQYPTELNIDFLADPPTQLSKLIVQPLKLKLFDLPKDISKNQPALNTFANDLKSLDNSMTYMLGRAAENTDIVIFVRAMHIVACCSLVDESKRPDTSTVREARSTIQRLSKVTGCGAEMSRAVMTYQHCMMLLENASEYAAGGLADQNTTNMFARATEKWEALLGSAFDDIEAWLCTGHHGSRHDLSSLSPILDATSDMAVEAYHAAQHWSATALQTNAEKVADFLSSAMELARVAVVIELRFLKATMQAAFTRPTTTSSDRQAAVGETSAHVAEPTLGTTLPRDATSPPMDQSDGTQTTTITTEPGDATVATSVSAGRATLVDQADAFVDPTPIIENAIRSVHDFAKVINRLIKTSDMCFELITPRLGDKFLEFVEGRCMPTNVQVFTDSANESLKNVLVYLLETFSVAAALTTAEQTLLGNILNPLSQEYLSLSNFAKLHHKHSQSPLTIIALDYDDESIIPAKPICNTIAEDFQGFVDMCGGPAYTLLESTCRNFWLNNISSAAIRMNIVSEAVMTTNDKSKIFPMLVRDPSASDLVPKKHGDLMKEPRGRAAFADFSYNRSLELLGDFAFGVGMEHITLGEVTTAGSNEATAVPTNLALAVLGLITRSRDIASLAAMLHQRLMMPADGRTEFVDTDRDGDPFEHLTAVLAGLMASLGDLEGETLRAEVVLFETSGYMCQPSIMTIRDWQTNMSMYAKLCEGALLDLFDSELKAKIDSARLHIPAYEAVCEDGEYDFQLAKQLLLGKADNIVHHHNELHNCLSMMNRAGVALCITPKLAIHDKTSSTIAIALSTMTSLQRSTIMTMGADLLERYKDLPAGPAVANAFIKKHKEANSMLPAPFWDALESLCEHASGPIVHASPMKTTSSTMSDSPAHGSETSAASSGTALVRMPPPVWSPPHTAPTVGTSASPAAPSDAKRGLKRVRKA